MNTSTFLFDAVVLVHVATGFVGLAAFWVPVFARKGGRLHVQAGRVYAYSAYVVTLSAVTAAAGRIVSYMGQGLGLAENPELYGIAFFLGYLGVVTFANVRQGTRRDDRKRVVQIASLGRIGKLDDRSARLVERRACGW